MLSKENQTHLDMANDGSLEKEVRLYTVMERVGQGVISLKKAHELCTEMNLYSGHWVGVDAKATEVFEERMTGKPVTATLGSYTMDSETSEIVLSALAGDRMVQMRLQESDVSSMKQWFDLVAVKNGVKLNLDE